MIKQQNYIQLTSTYNNTQSIQIHCMTCAYNDTPIQLGPRHHPSTRTSDAPLPSEGMYDLQIHAVLLADSVNSMLESSGWCWSSTEPSGIYNGHHISNMEYGNIPLTMEISHFIAHQWASYIMDIWGYWSNKMIQSLVCLKTEKHVNSGGKIISQWMECGNHRFPIEGIKHRFTFCQKRRYPSNLHGFNPVSRI